MSDEFTPQEQQLLNDPGFQAFHQQRVSGMGGDVAGAPSGQEESFTPQEQALLNDPGFQAFHQQRVGSSQAKAQEPPDTGGFWAGAKSMAGETVKGIGQFGADYIPGVTQDNALKKWGQEVVDANPVPQGLQGWKEHPLDSALSFAGGMAAGVGTAGAIGALGQGIAKLPVPGPYGLATKAIGHGLTVAAPYIAFGAPAQASIREQQMHDNPESATSLQDKLLATAGAGTVGAITHHVGPQGRLGMPLLTAAGRSKLGAALTAENLVGNIAKGAGMGAGQALLAAPVEQAASYHNPFTPDNLLQTAEGAASAALGGGIVGGAMHAGNRALRGKGGVNDTSTPKDLLNPSLPAEAPRGTQGELLGEGGGKLPDQMTPGYNDVRAVDPAAVRSRWEELRADREDLQRLVQERYSLPKTDEQAGLMLDPAKAQEAQAAEQRRAAMVAQAMEHIRVIDAEMRALSDGQPMAAAYQGFNPAQGDLFAGTGDAPRAPLADRAAAYAAQVAKDPAPAVKVAPTKKAAPAVQAPVAGEKRVFTGRATLPADVAAEGAAAAKAFAAKGKAEAPAKPVSPHDEVIQGADVPEAKRAAMYTQKGAVVKHINDFLNSRAAETDNDLATWHKAAVEGNATKPGSVKGAEWKIPLVESMLAQRGVQPLMTDAQAMKPATHNVPATPVDAALAKRNFGAKLTTNQQSVMDFVQTAIKEDRASEVIDAEGNWQVRKIATALGFKNPGSALDALNRVAANIAKAHGMTVEQLRASLKARGEANRAVDAADADKLGLSPEQQSRTGIEGSELFGNAETGAEQHMGIIEGPGGSQTEVQAHAVKLTAEQLAKNKLAVADVAPYLKDAPTQENSKAGEKEQRAAKAEENRRKKAAEAEAAIQQRIADDADRARLNADMAAKEGEHIPSLDNEFGKDAVDTATDEWNAYAHLQAKDGVGTPAFDTMPEAAQRQAVRLLNYWLGQKGRTKTGLYDLFDRVDHENDGREAVGGTPDDAADGRGRLAGGDAPRLEARVGEPARVGAPAEPKGTEGPARLGSDEPRAAASPVGPEGSGVEAKGSKPVIEGEAARVPEPAPSIEPQAERALQLLADMRGKKHDLSHVGELRDLLASHPDVAEAVRERGMFKNMAELSDAVDVAVKDAEKQPAPQEAPITKPAPEAAAPEAKRKGYKEGEKHDARVRFNEHTEEGIAWNESVLAAFRRIEPDDYDIAFDAPEYVGSILLANIDRQHGGTTGRASEVLDSIVSWADAHGERMVLSAKASGALRQDGLVSWYERRGFVKDSEGHHVREPKGDLPRGAAPEAKPGVSEHTDEATLRATLASIAGKDSHRNVTIYDTVQEALAAGTLKSVNAKGAQAWVSKGRAYFVAENIQKGQELAVFLHEIGTHLGMEKAVGPANYAKLTNQVTNWLTKGTGVEGEIARAAHARVLAAEGSIEGGITKGRQKDELLAYFVEEAVKRGVDPTDRKYDSALGRWFSTLWAGFQAAMKRMGLNPDSMTAQDIVNLAHGAAKVELTGEHPPAEAERVVQRKRTFTPEKSAEPVAAVAKDATPAEHVDSTLSKEERGTVATELGAGDYAAGRTRLLEMVAESFNGVVHKVSAALHAVMEKVKTGLMSVAVALNFSTAVPMPNGDHSVPVTKFSLSQMIDRPKADFGAAQAPLQVRQVADWQARSGRGQPFVVVDKVGGTLYAFDKAGKLIETTPVLTGRAPGDVQTAPNTGKVGDAALDGMKDGEKITPAGVFGATQIPSKAYGSMVRVTGMSASPDTTVIAIHRVYLGDPKENRMLRMASANPADRRISYGCINVPEAFYNKVMKQHFAGDSTVVVLPEKASNEQFFRMMSKEQIAKTKTWTEGGERDTASATTADRAMVGKEEGPLFSKAAPDIEAARTPEQRKEADEFFTKQIDRIPNKALRDATGSTYFGVRDAVRNGLLGTAFVHDLIDHMEKLGAPSARKYSDTMEAKNRLAHVLSAPLQIIADKANALKTHELAKDGALSVNRFMSDMSYAGKWAWQLPADSPLWKGKQVSVDPALVARFRALSPAAQEVVKLAVDYGETMRQELAKVGVDINAHDGPYIPHKRFGNWLSISKSAEYARREALKDGSHEALKDDPNHYHVSAFEGSWDARTFRNEQRKNAAFAGDNLDSRVYHTKAEEYFSQIQLAPMQQIARLESMINGDHGLSARQKTAIVSSLQNLYKQTLSNVSARHAEQRRANVAGADGDMLRALFTQGHASSSLVASLAHGKEIEQSITAMRDEANKNDKDGHLKEGLNELLKRHALSMLYRPTPIQNKIMALTAFQKVITSPAFFLQQTVEPFMMLAPVLAGRFNDYRGAMKEMGSAYAQAMQAIGLNPMHSGSAPDTVIAKLKGHKNSVGRDYDAIQELIETGRADLGNFNEFGNLGARADKPVAHAVNTVLSKVSRVATDMEEINRIASGLTAYRMMYKHLTAAGKGADAAHDEATAYATKMVDHSHGNYSAWASPRFMMQANSVVPIRVITQFRKFQVMQLSLLGRLTHGAFHADTPEAKAMARKALGYMTAQMVVVAGGLGVPMAGVASDIASLFLRDEDEPWGRDTTELHLRKLIGDPTLANLLLHGAPAAAGVDVSKRIGGGGMGDLAPYAELDVGSRKGFEGTLPKLLGPFIGGTLPATFDTYKLFRQGEYQKGMESLTPSMLTNLSKAQRFAEQGVTNSKGDVLLKPEQLSSFDIASQALGLPSTHLTERQFKQSALMDQVEKWKELEERYTHQFVKASRDKDAEAKAEAVQGYKGVQDAKRAAGGIGTPLSTLYKAPMEQIKRQVQNVGGVEVTKQTRGIMRRMEQQGV